MAVLGCVRIESYCIENNSIDARSDPNAARFKLRNKQRTNPLCQTSAYDYAVLATTFQTKLYATRDVRANVVLITMSSILSVATKPEVPAAKPLPLVPNGLVKSGLASGLLDRGQCRVRWVGDRSSAA